MDETACESYPSEGLMWTDLNRTKETTWASVTVKNAHFCLVQNTASFSQTRLDNLFWHISWRAQIEPSINPNSMRYVLDLKIHLIPIHSYWYHRRIALVNFNKGVHWKVYEGHIHLLFAYSQIISEKLFQSTYIDMCNCAHGPQPPVASCPQVAGFYTRDNTKTCFFYSLSVIIVIREYTVSEV